METILQSIKAKVKHIAIIGACLLVAAVGWHYWYKHSKKVIAATSSTVLQDDQRAKLIVDPVKHTITTVVKNPDGTTKTDTTYIGDSVVSVTEGTNGKITMQTKVWAPEKRPYLGVGYDTAPRIQVGMDFLYWKRLDLGAGVGFDPSILRNTNLNLSLSYTVWSNTSVALSLSNRKEIGGFIKVRF